MLIENEFVVGLPPEKAFETLFDVQLVASCVPGAELVESISPTQHGGKVAVRLGPVSMRFAGVVSIVERDPTALTGRIQAKGADEKGRGSAQSTTEFKIEPVAGGSRVVTKTELSLSGLAAQYGRASGVVRVLANELVAAFAGNLRARLDASETVSRDGEPGSVRPHHSAAAPSFSLFGFLWSAMKRRMRRADVSVAKQSR
jgi:carbon monoxide dehydrogenase subunit G